ncbi:hypothetical protein [Parerythrobacter lacustris]|uniref:Serine kinase n=1 Tax=Parerythrobacter lacustris TaxID=2969984 RepID=A0ABT1XNH1_9SPHN|nr:hypothetical protein [Parerythrobacter lacustris]MCR2833198.1 hypothetical protein [Parerythrobacter lacustris]
MPNYRVYGFIVASDLPLPVLPRAEAGEPDVTIAAGPVPGTEGLRTQFRNWEAEPDRFIATFHETGRFLVSGGNRITYHRFDHADDSQVVSILLGTCMAALLMQRRILPLHSCSVRTDQGAVLVMGVSGAGKSTTLGGLMALGLPMMADDVTGIVFGESGQPMAIPAFPATRLWQDSLEKLGHGTAGLPRVRTDLAKFYRAVDGFHPEAEPIRAIVYLKATNASEPRFHPIELAQRTECVSRFVHRKNFLDGMHLRRWGFDSAVAIVRKVPLFELARPSGWVEPVDLAKTILAGIAASEDMVRATA